jgi:D-sedoheptulose 7-phosphate isomerase
VARLQEGDRLRQLADTAVMLAEAVASGATLLFFGNGGSAADASHLAAEFVGRCRTERRALPALCLTDASAALTALANDYGYDEVFARQLRAFGRPGDIAIGLSTSGTSPNVLRGLDTARELGLRTIGFSGESGGEMASRCDVLLRAPSSVTPRIQECHQVWGHVLAEYVEDGVAS